MYTQFLRVRGSYVYVEWIYADDATMSDCLVNYHQGNTEEHVLLQLGLAIQSRDSSGKRFQWLGLRTVFSYSSTLQYSEFLEFFSHDCDEVQHYA